MCAREREARTPLVIEEGRLPFRRIVAIGARRDPVPIGELRAMDVLMTFFTLLRGRFEIHVHHSGFQVRRLMAVYASGAAMRPHQRKTGLRMIEFLQVFPRTSRMAGFAASLCAIGAPLQHSILELPLMRIGVTDCARTVLKAVQHRMRIF